MSARGTTLYVKAVEPSLVLWEPLPSVVFPLPVTFHWTCHILVSKRRIHTSCMKLFLPEGKKARGCFTMILLMPLKSPSKTRSYDFSEKHKQDINFAFLISLEIKLSIIFKSFQTFPTVFLEIMKYFSRN